MQVAKFMTSNAFRRGSDLENMGPMCTLVGDEFTMCHS
jgi:hypothetical protein